MDISIFLYNNAVFMEWAYFSIQDYINHTKYGSSE